MLFKWIFLWMWKALSFHHTDHWLHDSYFMLTCLNVDWLVKFLIHALITFESTFCKYYPYSLLWVYRHTLFYYTSQILWFFTNRMFVAILCLASLPVSFFWQHLLTLCLCVTFLVILQSFEFFIIVILVVMICDLWCYYYESLKAQMIVSIF